MAVFGHVSPAALVFVSPAALVSGEDSEHRIGNNDFISSSQSTHFLSEIPVFPGMPFRDDKTTNLIVPWDALASLHCVGSRQQSPHGSTRVVDSNSYTGNAHEGLQTPTSNIVYSRIAPRVPCQTQNISTPSSANTETHRLLSALPVMQQIPVGLRYATTSPPVLLSHVDRGNEGDGVKLYPQPFFRVSRNQTGPTDLERVTPSAQVGFQEASAAEGTRVTRPKDNVC